MHRGRPAAGEVAAARLGPLLFLGARLPLVCQAALSLPSFPTTLHSVLTQ
jgi:hypothetical protein